MGAGRENTLSLKIAIRLPTMVTEAPLYQAVGCVVWVETASAALQSGEILASMEFCY